MIVFCRFKERFGWKDRLLFRCPNDQHSWRETFGDERMHYKRWQCRICPAARDVL